MEDLVITKAKQEDLDDILEMYIRRVTFNNEHNIPQWRYEDVTWDELSKTYTIDDYYVGKVDGNICCGMFVVDVDALYWPEEPKGKYLYLHKICVDPAYSKRGYADQLISYFKQLGRDHNHKQVRLDVRAHKDKLRAMYERNGFRLVRMGKFLPECDTALYCYNFDWDKK